MYNKEHYHQCPIKYVVYVVRIEGKNIFKIGSTNRLQHRLRNLLQGVYEPCHVFATIQVCCAEDARGVEKGLHGVMAQYRLRREWFACPPDELVAQLQTFQGPYHVELFQAPQGTLQP